jgi:hypothetical protein
VPKHVYFRDELPKTNVGKILRRELRDELQHEVAARERACPPTRSTASSIGAGVVGLACARELAQRRP